jgi:hypothetical protein
MLELFPLGWGHYLAGGVLLGVGMSLLFVSTGLIGGMSSVFTTVWSFFSASPYFQQPRFIATRNWRLVYAVGIVLGALLWMMLLGEPFVTQVPYWRLAVGGLLAGYGARLSGGCTSGHGICGMASVQPASILAVCTFLATAMATAHLVKAFL